MDIKVILDPLTGLYRHGINPISEDYFKGTLLYNF